MKVIVIGDLIKDRYIYGTVERISPEAPVPIVKQLKVEERLGGAGLVYENLFSLNVDVDILSYDDVSTKTRVFADNYYVSRIDDDIKTDGKCILEKVKGIDFSCYSYAILSDYNKGALDRSLDIIKHINSFGCKVIVDPKRSYDNYEGAWLIKPNAKEYKEFRFDLWKNNIIVTNSSENVKATIENKSYISEVFPIKVNDVTGAGDCFLATFVYCLTKKYDYQKCIDIANKASRIAVSFPGTYIIKPSDIKDKIVFTNGCFDIIHRGHIEYLRQSKLLGDKLIIGLNSDSSIKRLKGHSRPINNQDDRKIVLESLKWVDEVIIFEEDTPYELIKKLNPDIITKGDEYKIEDVVGNDISKVVLIKMIEGKSTTNIVSKL